MKPHPLDEYPVHQAPLSLRYPATSDRNFYDRYYFNAHDRTGDVFVVTGLGVYPNLGVVDAFATVARGSEHITVRAGGALDDDTARRQVGPFSVEIIEPLQQLRLTCDAAHLGLTYDLTWQGSFAAVEEPRHVHRQGTKVILDACRFAQLGSWTGALRIDGTDFELTADRWVGSRDRSWGIRPVGEAEPASRFSSSLEGFWWTYAPLRFDDFALVCIVQEDHAGHRMLNEAVRVWGDERYEQLGWPEVSVRYRSGTRIPTGATIELRHGLSVDVECLGFAALNAGAGYGGDPGWAHGTWKGAAWEERAVVDVNDPAVAARLTFGVIDHVARATCDGHEGWGLFEHGTFGRHDPSGFAGWDSVAR